MIGLGAALTFVAGYLDPANWGALLWLAGLTLIVGGVALGLGTGAVYLVHTTIRANRPSADLGRRRGRRHPRSSAPSRQ